MIPIALVHEAIEREELAKQNYQQLLASSGNDEDMQALFSFLIGEEERHAQWLRDFFHLEKRPVGDAKSEEAPLAEEGVPVTVSEALERVRSVEIEAARGYERLLFESADERERQLFKRLRDEEMSHLDRLKKL